VVVVVVVVVVILIQIFTVTAFANPANMMETCESVNA